MKLVTGTYSSLSHDVSSLAADEAARMESAAAFPLTAMRSNSPVGCPAASRVESAVKRLSAGWTALTTFALSGLPAKLS